MVPSGLVVKKEKKVPADSQDVTVRSLPLPGYIWIRFNSVVQVWSGAPAPLTFLNSSVVNGRKDRDF